MFKKFDYNEYLLKRADFCESSACKYVCGKVMFTQAPVCSGRGVTSNASWDRPHDRYLHPRERSGRVPTCTSNVMTPHLRPGPSDSDIWW